MLNTCLSLFSSTFKLQQQHLLLFLPVVNMKWIKRRRRVKRRIEEDGIDLAIVTVDILKTAAAAATSIPALGAAAGIVSSILQQISQAQQNTELALRIAARCAGVLATISKHLETLAITPAILNNIRSFEANLYEIQDFIETETSHNIFYLTLHAKQRAGRLQDLQLRVQETMSLFQITTLISIHDIVHRLSTSYLEIKDAVSGQGRLERTLKDEPDVRPVEELDVIPEEELLVGKGFRLLLAQVGGNNAVLKVFEGKDAQENYGKTVNFEKHLIHSNLLRLKSHYASGSSPFIVYNPDIQATAEQVIAAAIPTGVIPTFIAGAQLISGVAAALSHLLRRGTLDLHSLGIENFSIFTNRAGKVVLSFDGFSNSTSVVSRRDRTGLDILSDLCHQTFNAANEILYRDTQARTNDTLEPSNASIVDAENEDQINTASDKPDTVATIDANLSRLRREIMWQGVGGNNMTLDDISYQFKTVVSSLSFTLFSLEHVARTARGYRTVHRCPGYRRQEVTLRPVLSDCKVITHVTPFLHERCMICGKDVEEGQFNCNCGQRALVVGSLDGCITDRGYPADDGISPTVKCSKCSVWGHRHCNDQLDYICWRCIRAASSNHNDDNSGTASTVKPMYGPQMQMVMKYADLSPAELRAKDIQEHIVVFIENHRAQIQRIAAEQNNQ
ncbi:hypothetical protein ARMGADRAFT_1070201 [Armillaria gallica]|uniref:Uncharacterized protein n=1 Tax=Armillaria gallica TaxID=47427 RepID=A0A2H3EK91_ARMGA|nr:hypothetical protein ARMGADRAFT_1070201 [Armillaria gallica]